MFKTSRHQQIVQIIETQKDVTVNHLCELFNVSVGTIRSDLNALERQGKVVRTHGGAIAAEKTEVVEPFIVRKDINAKKKQAIAKAAAKMVNGAESIFIDGGTTAMQMSRYLVSDSTTTIITPSIEIAYRMGTQTDFNIYMLNGFIRRKSFSTAGLPRPETLDRLNISKAFVGASGFTLEEGFSDLSMDYIEQKRAICQKAVTVIGLVDSSKLGVVSLASFVGTNDIDIIITDKEAPAALIRQIKEHQIEVIVA